MKNIKNTLRKLLLTETIIIPYSYMGRYIKIGNKIGKIIDIDSEKETVSIIYEDEPDKVYTVNAELLEDAILLG